MFAEAAICVPALTSFVATCYGKRSDPVFFQIESGKRLNIEHCSSSVQQGDSMGPELFCMPLLPVLKRTQASSQEV